MSTYDKEKNSLEKLRLWRQSYQIQTTKLDKIINNLFISDLKSAADKNLLKYHKIEAIVSLCRFPQKSIDGVEYLYLPVYDSPETKVKHFFSKVNSFIHYHRLNQKNVLVHCVKGISRSVCFVTAYLMTIEPNLNYSDAIAFMESKHPISRPNNGFKQQLMEFNKEVKSDLELESRSSRLYEEYIELKKNDLEFFKKILK